MADVSTSPLIAGRGHPLLSLHRPFSLTDHRWSLNTSDESPLAASGQAPVPVHQVVVMKTLVAIQDVSFLNKSEHSEMTELTTYMASKVRATKALGGLVALT